MTSIAAQEVAKEKFIKKMRETPLTSELYFEFIHDVMEKGTKEELGFLLEEVDRVLAAVNEHCKPFVPQKPYKNYRLKEDSPIISVSLRFDILKRDGYRCKICGRNADDGVKLHVDHKKAFSVGGKTIPENLQALCFECNLGKKAKDL